MAGGAREVVHELARALVAVVHDVEAPRVVHRLAGLQRQRADLRLLVELRRALPGQVLLEHLEVLAGEGPVVVVVPDERGRLQLVDEAVGPLEAPVRLRLVPPAIEPDPADLAVLREQLAELAVHVVEVAVPVPVVGPAGIATRAPSRVVVGMVPVQLGVVEEELYPLTVALVGQHLQDVLVVRRAVDDVVVRDLGVEHGEAVVVLARDRDVPHACRPGQGDPFRRIELRDGVLMLAREDMHLVGIARVERDHRDE